VGKAWMFGWASLPPQIGVPLKSQEMEDIVIFLSSLGKYNAITTDVLVNAYKHWSLTQQRSSIPMARKGAYPPRPTPGPGLVPTAWPSWHLLPECGLLLWLAIDSQALEFPGPGTNSGPLCPFKDEQDSALSLEGQFSPPEPTRG
jgi:hypothetical protein